MKVTLLLPIAALILAGITKSVFAVDYANKTITVVEVYSSGSGCYFFQLAGVTVADSTTGINSPWFAISESQPGGKAMLSQLLTARVTSMPFARVTTNGQTVCGQAQVSVIDL